jgi:hypothetical protein
MMSSVDPLFLHPAPCESSARAIKIRFYDIARLGDGRDHRPPRNARHFAVPVMRREDSAAYAPRFFAARF